MFFLGGAFLLNPELDSVMTAYFIPIYTAVSRFAMPVFAFATVYGGLKSLWNGSRRGGTARAALISTVSGEQLPLLFTENLLGRDSASDIVLNIPSISRKHAVIREENGEWFIIDLDSRSGVRLNGTPVLKTAVLQSGDYIELGGVEYMFNAASYVIPATAPRHIIPVPRIFDRTPSQGRLMLYMLVFQLMSSIQVIFRAEPEYLFRLASAFAAYLLFEWLCFIFRVHIQGCESFTHELFGFYLTGIGLCVIAASEPDRLITQLIIIAVSVMLYLILLSLLRNQKRIMRLRPFLAAFGIGLFAVNLILGTSRFGSKNWLELFGFSFQPSELVKVVIVLTGAVTLERMSDRKDFLLFSAYSCACILCLFVMGDFGTAAIFFITFIVLLIMRTGRLELAGGICLAAAAGAAIITTLKPYIANRFAAWLHVWDYPSTIGYQQTRTLIAAASGGLLGIGGGAGYLRNIAAATTDLVFGVLCEEWGLITAVISVSALAGLGIIACAGVKSGRGAYYATASCAAATLLLFQACLNIFGSTDILPLTGVTLPFVSRGGSSMLSCWMLLAVLKASHKWEKEAGQ